MNSLGIYFGPRVISLAETKGTKLIKNINIPWSAALGAESLEEKVPREVKLVALLKDELIKNKIDTKEATVSLSGKDLIIRTFEMPVLPAREMSAAINFESKKYIPFRLEELICDSQWRADKTISKNHVLYVGIRKEILEKYILAIKQAGLDIKGIEYCAFSVLRLFKLTHTKEKGIIGLFNADLKEEDEVNFIVLESGFPLFSRDIILTAAGPAGQRPEEIPGVGPFDKLKREIRISLDYYHRKFPGKKIEKTFFFCGPDYRPELEAFIKEIGLQIQFVEITKYTGAEAFSLSFTKSYAASISGSVRSGITVDLFAAKAKLALARPAVAGPQIFRLAAGLSIEPKIALAAVLMCLLLFLFGLFRINNAKITLKRVIERAPQVSGVSPDANYEELAAINSGYEEKIAAIDNLKKGRLYLTSLLDIIPRIIPDNIWLKKLSFTSKETALPELTMEGIAYLGDSIKEVELINTFRGQIARNAVIAKYFKKINIVSVERDVSGEEKNAETNFLISCQNE